MRSRWRLKLDGKDLGIQEGCQLKVFLHALMKVAETSSLDYSYSMAISFGMPTVLRIGPYRFFFYAGDRDEPEHVHVERDDNVARFWLDPVELQRSGGFGRSEIIRVLKLVDENKERLVRSWNEYFNH